MSAHRLVIIESPYVAETIEEIMANDDYAHRCILDSLRRGEAPFASHVLYTRALDDSNVDQRAKGIDAGFAWRAVATATIVYTDRGVSHGMRMGICHAHHIGQPVEFRSIDGN